MMNAEQLSRVGEKLVKRCGSRDPFEIARQLGINVMLCENFGSLKGMYRVIKRNRFIFLNNSLDENMLRIVCAHELGHDQLHRNMAKTTPIHEFMLYDMKSKPEYEANIVAAEILMDSDEVLRYIYEYGYTAEQIAARRAAVQCLRLRSAHKFQLPGLRLPHNDCPLGSVHSFSSCSTGGSSTTPHSVPSSSVP